jgi:hypothetical protein
LRHSPRRRLSADDRRFRLAFRLTERDREILRALDRVGVLTAPQIAEAFFGSGSRARTRLAVLYEDLEAVDRFRPGSPEWGSEPFHYVLGKYGAGVLAAEAGEDPASAERRWSRGRTIALASSQRLRHMVGVSGFYAALAGEARRTPGAELARWLTEREAARACGGGGYQAATVLPDGWGLWREGGDEAEFFFGVRPRDRDAGDACGQAGGLRGPGARARRLSLGALRVPLGPARGGRPARPGGRHGGGRHRRPGRRLTAV